MGNRKGSKTPGSGRTRGVPNKVNRRFKEILETAMLRMQQHPTHNIYTWCTRNPDLFYTLCKALLPAQLKFPDEDGDKEPMSMKELGRRVAYIFLEAQREKMEDDKRSGKLIEHNPLSSSEG